jgi:hypothetical protein
MNMGIFNREPALVIGVATSVLAAVIVEIPQFDANQQQALIVLVVALGALAKAVLVRPFEVAAITGVSVALGTALAAFAINFPPTKLAAITAAVIAGITLLERQQVSPASFLAGRNAQP